MRPWQFLLSENEVLTQQGQQWLGEFSLTSNRGASLHCPQNCESLRKLRLRRRFLMLKQILR